MVRTDRETLRWPISEHGDTKLNDSDAFNSAIGSSTREKATLTVTSVKMITAACP